MLVKSFAKSLQKEEIDDKMGMYIEDTDNPIFKDFKSPIRYGCGAGFTI